MDDMDLPPGKTCSDCFHFHRCVMLFGCKPASTRCDWAPSRFIPQPTPAEQEAILAGLDEEFRGGRKGP